MKVVSWCVELYFGCVRVIVPFSDGSVMVYRELWVAFSRSCHLVKGVSWSVE